MGNVLSALRPRVVGVSAALGLLVWYMSRKKRSPRRSRSEGASESKAGDGGSSSSKRKKKPRIGKAFWSQLKAVLKRSTGPREWMNLLMLTLVLIGRTGASLMIAANMGSVVQNFCNQRWDLVRSDMVGFATISVGAALLNAALKYYNSMTSLNVRQHLTTSIHNAYMKDMIYYKANKVADSRGVLENADQLITDDVAKFADCLSDVYSNLLKPTVDFFMFSYQLGSMMGATGPLGMYAWFAVATIISAKVLPSYGRMAAKEQQLEGRYRAAHSNLIQNSEMVAFMRGEIPERVILDQGFSTLRKHCKSTLNHKLVSNIVTGYVNKYAASVVGFALVALPVHNNVAGMASWSPGQIAKYYVATRQLMEGLANAVLAIFDLQKRIGTLAGLTFRVWTLLQSIEKRHPILQDRLKEAHEAGNPPKFEIGDVLSLDRVSVFKPDGTLLVKDLTFTLQPGERVIITGDNGCGKSSLFRVIRGLWPLVSGHMITPPDDKVYFLSQVNFVPIGTLREIIVYPHTLKDMEKKGCTDNDLLQVLEWAHLANFKCNGQNPTLDTTMEWDTALSPGQKQRMAFARLLYHRPSYAVLDECTNGIAPDIEEDLYDRCRSLGMAVFSISHKVELRRLHDYRLHYHADAAGSYSFTPIVSD